MMSKLVIAIVLVAASGVGLEKFDLQARAGVAAAADTAPVTMPGETLLGDWVGPFYDYANSRYFFTAISRAPLNSDGRSQGWSAVGADLNRQQIAFNIHLVTVDDLLSFQQRLAAQVTRVSVNNPVDKIHHGMGIDLDRPPPPPCCQPGGDDWAQSVMTLGNLNMRHQIAAFNGAFQGTQ